MSRFAFLMACLCACCSAEVAEAQVTISGGVGWSGGYDVGGSTAELRTNAPGAASPPFRLFSVDSRISPAPGGEVRVGVVIARDITLEGGAVLSRRRLAFTIAGDAEAGAQRLPGETLQNYLFDAGVLWELPPPVPRGRRVRAYAAGGAGYLRQLHQDRTLVESGEVYYVGGGARYWLRGRPASPRSLGLRGDVRMNLRRRGIDFENRARIFPTASVLVFIAL